MSNLAWLMVFVVIVGTAFVQATKQNIHIADRKDSFASECLSKAGAVRFHSNNWTIYGKYYMYCTGVKNGNSAVLMTGEIN